MNGWLALLGVIVALLMGGFGLVAGEFKRLEKDPEWQAEVERRKKELERQKAWKDKWK
jgi:hypothetical protein